MIASATFRARLIAGISFAGAAVGTGILEKGMAPNTPNFKLLVIQRLARAREEIENAKLTPIVYRIATKCRDQNIQDSSARESLLWAEMFPEIDYEKRFSRIGEIAVQNGTALLQWYMTEYKEWRAYLWMKIHKRRVELAMRGAFKNLDAPINEWEINEEAKRDLFQPDPIVEPAGELQERSNK
jgi:hypothetical protein